MTEIVVQHRFEIEGRGIAYVFTMAQNPGLKIRVGDQVLINQKLCQISGIEMLGSSAACFQGDPQDRPQGILVKEISG